jgi:hypothetical protein
MFFIIIFSNQDHVVLKKFWDNRTQLQKYTLRSSITDFNGKSVGFGFFEQNPCTYYNKKDITMIYVKRSIVSSLLFITKFLIHFSIFQDLPLFRWQIFIFYITKRILKFSPKLWTVLSVHYSRATDRNILDFLFFRKYHP